MSGSWYAVVGQWSFSPVPRGMTAYSYDPDTAALDQTDTALPRVNVGQLAYSAQSGLLYFTDECRDQEGRQGGGGYVGALRLGAGGRLDALGSVPSYGALPCAMAASRDGRHLVVANHASRMPVTRTVRLPQGGWQLRRVYDDASLAVFRLGADGIPEALVDYRAQDTEGPDGFLPSLLHTVVRAPGGDYFIATDLGRNRLYAVQMEPATGALATLPTLEVLGAAAVRYLTFHPRLPLFYCNDERACRVYAFRWDADTGRMEQLATLDYTGSVGPAQNCMPSDICIDSAGRALYLSVRGAEKIAVVPLDAQGQMQPGPAVPCGGQGPRGLCLSPDGRWLYAANTASQDVTALPVLPDATLGEARVVAQGSCPGCIAFVKA